MVNERTGSLAHTWESLRHDASLAPQVDPTGTALTLQFSDQAADGLRGHAGLYRVLHLFQRAVAVSDVQAGQPNETEYRARKNKNELRAQGNVFKHMDLNAPFERSDAGMAVPAPVRAMQSIRAQEQFMSVWAIEAFRRDSEAFHGHPIRRPTLLNRLRDLRFDRPIFYA